MSRWSLAAIIVVILSVLVGLSFIASRPHQTITTDNERFLQFLSSEFTGLNYKGKPIFKIDSIAKFENKWYIISISSLRETKQEVPVYVILRDINDAPQVILGPSAHFTETEMLQYNIPDAIIRELTK